MYRITLFLPDRFATGAANAWFFFCNELPVGDSFLLALAREYWPRGGQDQVNRDWKDSRPGAGACRPVVGAPAGPIARDSTTPGFRRHHWCAPRPWACEPRC